MASARPGAPVSAPAFLNAYNYADANPLTKVDPDGRCPFCAIPVIIELGELTIEGYEAYRAYRMARTALTAAQLANQLSRAPQRSQAPPIRQAPQTMQAARGSGYRAVMGLKAAIAAQRLNNRKAIVIGENQNRVDAVAAMLHAEVYVAPHIPAGHGEAAWKAANRRWINAKMDEGVTIYDIGPALGRDKFPLITSDYYGIERFEITRRRYYNVVRIYSSNAKVP
jgi:hypothetical protein